MKYRDSFISNSSSSSFVLSKKHLTHKQIQAIMNHHIKCDSGDAWSISETEETIDLFTDMDNFSMGYYLNEIGVPEKAYIEKEYD